MKDIFIRFLKVYNIRFTRPYIDDLFSSSPAPASFWTLKNMLCRYSIDSECVHFNKREINDEMAPLFVIYNGDIIIVTGCDDRNLQAIGVSGTKMVISMESFIQHWDGNAVVAYVGENSCEPCYDSHKNRVFVNAVKNIVVTLAILLLSIGIVQSFIENSDSVSLIILFLNIIGSIVSILLLMRKNGFSNNITNVLCKHGTVLDCDSVITSNQSRVFGLFDLSELCAAFYVTNTIYLVHSRDYMPEIYFFIRTAFPITIWSVFVQAFRLKHWCTLCLSASCLVWLNAALILFSSMPKTVVWSKLFYVCASYLIILLVFNKISALHRKINDGVRLRKEFNGLRYSEQVLSCTLRNAPIRDMVGVDKYGIQLGDDDCDITITVISNPFCRPCAQMHKRLNEIINSSIRIQYLFIGLTDRIMEINRYLTAAYHIYGDKVAWKLLTDWFETGNKCPDFFNKLNLDINDMTIIEETYAVNEWIRRGNFVGTPTVLVNGKEVQWPYAVEDYILYSSK